MWRNQFTEDLQKIFKFKHIVFGSSIPDSQKDIAWVDANSNVSFAGDKKIAFVTGTISVIGSPENMPDGRLSEIYQVSKIQTSFRITSKERYEYPMGDNQLKMVSFDFVYEYSVDFNPKKSLTQMLWDFIIR
jgi:hypothetical protein